MKVRVVPIHPIPGILPKNKWIDTEMELDLNKNEIIRCMQYGNVYDFLDNVIDTNYIAAFDKHVTANYCHLIVPKPEVQGVITTASTTDEPLVIDMKEDIPEDVFINEPFETIYSLEVLSCEKEDDYIILETQFNSKYEKIGGNIYGLFTKTSGSKPNSLEFKVENEWVKFSNKFRDFSALEDKTKFIFRILPKNNSEVEFNLSIKDGKDILSSIIISINPEEL